MEVNKNTLAGAMTALGKLIRTKVPGVNSHYTLRTQDELDRFEFIACRIEKAVDAGLFYPNENIINCAECPYADRCKKATWKGD